MSLASYPQFQAPFRAFLNAIPAAGHVVVFCHFDADGLGAGAVFGRGLNRINPGWRVTVLPSGKGENAFLTPTVRDKLLALQPDALIVTDLGVHAHGTLEADGVPVLYVDHHIPEGQPPAGATVLTGYGLEPTPCSAWLAYELLAAETDVTDLQWVAAIGIISDLGEKAEWAPLAQVKKQHTAKYLKEAVALCNAARRAGAFDLERPLQYLLHDDGPRQLAQDEVLAGYRAQVAADLAVARKMPPKFPPKEAPGAAPVAVVTIDSPRQIHPLVAQQWITRLPDRVVLCANLGYLPDGVVAVSGRTASRSLHIPDLLRAAFARLGQEPPANFAHGHPQASGGHLPQEQYQLLLRGLGFEV
ncbi:DHH family phosphoesterase [Hymenobacter weizhouensis]|uniref:DHH family phosphoesterase n=1 Tax=Hymenobacter sp. YIM 151500-1 TaxID=2987689 RepID=UPI00222711AE|nr:DHH family phosphoesterase [Hymenobacter sp. YIM 151500-1]UYZ62379.1 DHH family phosphoesterase [Hymenobacter sp. YIM 151500-1]